MAEDDRSEAPEDESAIDDRKARDLTAAPGGGGKGIDYRRASGSDGFFHIYKSGQGYWTRIISAAGAGLIGLFTANFIYSDLGSRIEYLANHKGITLAITGTFLALFALLCYWLINKPRNADFLIATDSEMKKVNWTSTKELIGSTRVVIIFMFLIAFMLFAIDIMFGYVFHWMRILKNPPF